MTRQNGQAATSGARAMETGSPAPPQRKCACGCGTLFAPNPNRANHKYYGNHRQRAYFVRQERKLRRQIRRELKREMETKHAH